MDWLDVLHAVLPPRGVLLVGAGSGQGAWIRWLRTRDVAPARVPVHLVEGDEERYRALQRTCGADAGWTTWRDVVAPKAGATIFHRASNASESGLLPIQDLRELWPNLAPGEQVAVDGATTLDALHAEAGTDINWLLLDCLPAAALLQGGAQLLSQVDVALVRVASGLPQEALAGQQAVDQVLGEAGMRCVHSQSERHPALAHVLYVRDTGRRLEECQRACKALEEQLQQAESQARQAKQAWEKERVELAQAKQAAIESESQSAERLKQASDHARQWEACQKIVSDMEKRLRTALDKGLANSVKQVEDFISIQSYLSTGDGLSNFHGWPISPDIGLFLIDRIRERRHDLVIEFGSGTSTALFAKTLQVSRPDGSSKAAGQGSAGKTAKVPPRVGRPVCAFEHDRLYLHKTRAMLEAQGLLDLVALNHAPLVDWQDDSGQYLYYDCDATLAALARQLGSQTRRVLVLVDGPPGATCDNARYPAVPLIFRHFSRHQVDVVLDDANRPEEKAVIELWRAYWTKHSIRMTESAVQSEKGLYWTYNYENTAT